MAAGAPAGVGSLFGMDRDRMAELLSGARQKRNEWIRRQVIEHDRVDILATEVLDYQMQPFHYRIVQHQFAHPKDLQLCFRGAGKSTIGTVAKGIHLLLKNPDLRILIASKTLTQAQGFLRGIKNNFESNATLIEIFGPYYDPNKVAKWDNTEIEVLPRTSRAREASITCVGFEGAVVSKHYDVILADDLVDEDNSRTKQSRDKLKQWVYKTLDPTLEPPDPSVRHRGEFHALGTRYHFDDLYGHWIANEFKKHHQVIPALDAEGRSPWPEKFSPEFLDEKRRTQGIIIFESQMQCDTKMMKGEIFEYDACTMLSPDKWPETSSLRVYMGVDLAIGQQDENDMFAIVVIGLTSDGSGVYVLDFFEGKLRFSDQKKKILEYFERWDPIRIGLETNQYQDSQAQLLEEDEEQGELIGPRLRRIQTDKDKITRAWKLSALFDDRRVFFRDTQRLLVEHLVLFPGGRYKDLFDAFDHAYTASKKKKKRTEREEPGLI